MAEKIPFFDFFESFVPPRELRLLLHDACVTGGLLDRENRSMELELESGEEFTDAARSALEQLLQKQYDLRRLTLRVRSTSGKDDKGGSDILMGKEENERYVCEVNSNPQLQSTIDTCGINPATSIMYHIRSQMKNRAVVE